MRDLAARVRQFLDEPLVIERVKLEAVLAVAFEGRSCALVSLPADLPEGERLATEVEQSCREAYLAASNEGNYLRKLELVKAFTQARRSAFAKIVISSPAYLALLRWSKEFSLTPITSEVLPTTWEVYLFKGLRTRMRVRHLTAMRSQLRQTDARRIHEGAAATLFTEEFSPDYVRQLGALLEYPLCCTERFIQDRANNLTAEVRASEQIKSLKAEGREIDPFAYYVKDFFPCAPVCQQAKTHGARIHQVLSEISPEMGERYKKLATMNSTLVEDYPDILRKHREKLQSLRNQC